MQHLLMLGSLLTAVLVGCVSWRCRGRGWTEALASACVKSAMFWMLVFFSTLPFLAVSPRGVEIFASSMLFALFSAIASIIVAIFGPRPRPVSTDGPGLSPSEG